VSTELGRPLPEERENATAHLAHELRTPLNSIKGWAHVLESLIDDPDPMVVRAIEGILIGVDQQAALIEQMERSGRK